MDRLIGVARRNPIQRRRVGIQQAFWAADEITAAFNKRGRAVLAENRAFRLKNSVQRLGSEDKPNRK
jgi:hypothetical protein